jgi:hypothetical protein
MAASHINLTVTDNGTGVGLRCTAGKVEGAIEAGGLGKISTYRMSLCTTTSGSCPSPNAEAVNLPWKTELYSAGAQVRERLVSGGSGTPGWQFTCSGHTTDRCYFNTSAYMLNTVDGAEAIFNKESNKTACTGGAEVGQLEGSIAFAASEAGVEAIEIEPLASPEWQLGGKPISAAVETAFGAIVKVSHEIGVGKVLAVECEDRGAGTVGPGIVGEESSSVMSKCVTKSGTCPSPALHAENLSWSTELAVSEGALLDVATSGNKGSPGYQITCAGIIKETCTGMIAATLTNGTGGVDATYSYKEMACSLGGAPGVVEGVQVIEASKGGRLEVRN